jgi:signal transduction histidine kinase
MRRLSWKLGGSLVLIVIIAVGLMAVLTNINTTREFNQYITQGNQKNTQTTSAALAQYFANQGDWNNVQSLLPDFLRSANDRLIVVNTSGIIVADTENDLVGSSASSTGLSGGTAITTSAGTVGQLYLVSINGNGNSGKGMKSQGKGGQSTPMMTSMSTMTLEQDFFDRFNYSLLITGIIVAVVALILGLVLTRQITLPLKALVNGVRQIARGNLGHRVDIRSKDELHELGQSFNTMAASLDEAEQERKRIIADIAHDLRTPLTVIEGTVTGIQDGVFQPDKEHLSVIKDQTGLLTRLTGDLRELSLAESGRLKLNRETTDMADMVRRKAAQFEVKAREKGITISTILPAGLPAVNVDPARIEQVLGNLISNALQYIPSGRTITIAVKAEDKQGLIVSVADTGEGIAPEHLPHLFERFYRIEKSRTRNEGGSGLGLAIVKQLVQAHGGKAWVESTVGQGTTFYFSLPL